MQYRTPICQPDAARMSVVSGISTPVDGTECPPPGADTGTSDPGIEQSFVYGAGRVQPVRGAGQEIEYTASRRSGPRRWLRAVAWVLAAGLHDRAGATTARVAEDLAARMDYSTGWVRYCLDEIASRLGVDRATVKRHVAVLRELGLLAWAEHGSRVNVRRTLGLAGYAGTATVYAAVIPAAYDHAMGHRIVGTGYEARIVIEDAPRPVDNCPVDNSAPPSLTVVKGVDQAKDDSGLKDTSRKRASRRNPSSSLRGRRSRAGGGARRSPAQVARDCRIAAQVRPRVNWTQGSGIRRLAFALRPWIDRGLDVHEIAAELQSWMLLWRPADPAAYIRAQLAQQDAQAAVVAAARRPEDNAEWCAWAAADALRQMEAALNDALRSEEDRRLAREYAWNDPRLVADHIAEHGVDDALDLYGPRLVSLADSLIASGAQITARW